MKGLLIKDFCLLKGQKKFFVVVLLLAVAMGFSMADASTALGYMLFILPMFSISTIGYDEFDNGYPFLLTLPIDRRLYVVEKYLFSLLLGGVAMLIALPVALFIGAVKPDAAVEGLPVVAVGMFAAMLLVQAVMIPLQLKFGSEKGRVAILVAVGAMVALGFVIVKGLAVLTVDWAAIIARVLCWGPWVLGLLVAGAVALVLLLSVRISLRIMQKKEF